MPLHQLLTNADMTFDLIGNLGKLDYKIADSKEIIASYWRKLLIEFLQEEINDYSFIDNNHIMIDKETYTRK